MKFRIILADPVIIITGQKFGSCCLIWKNFFCIFHLQAMFCATLGSGSEQQRSPLPVTFGCFKSRHWNNGTSWGESRLPSCLASCRSFCLTWQTQCAPTTPHPLLFLHPSPLPADFSPSWIRQPSWSGLRKGRKKWDDKEEMINDNKATKGSSGSGTYHVDK